MREREWNGVRLKTNKREPNMGPHLLLGLGGSLYRAAEWVCVTFGCPYHRGVAGWGAGAHVSCMGGAVCSPRRLVRYSSSALLVRLHAAPPTCLLKPFPLLRSLAVCVCARTCYAVVAGSVRAMGGGEGSRARLKRKTMGGRNDRKCQRKRPRP